MIRDTKLVNPLKNVSDKVHFQKTLTFTSLVIYFWSISF